MKVAGGSREMAIRVCSKKLRLFDYFFLSGGFTGDGFTRSQSNSWRPARGNKNQPKVER